MFSRTTFFVSLLAFLATKVHAAPDLSRCHGKITPNCCADCFGELPATYTLTAIKVDDEGCYDPTYDGLKVENFELFQSQIGGYCPFTGAQASLCPNGTEMALSGTMHPVSRERLQPSLFPNRVRSAITCPRRPRSFRQCRRLDFNNSTAFALLSPWIISLLLWLGLDTLSDLSSPPEGVSHLSEE